MKIQCPACREIVELTEFTTSDAGLTVLCTACGKKSFVPNPRTATPDPGDVATPAADPAVATPGPGAAAVTCPKCGHTQKDPVACHRCGLVFARFDPSILPADPPGPTALWQEIQAHPGDRALHERFQQLCLQEDRLDYATRQYRLLQRDPANAALAADMQKRLLGLAQARLAPAMQPSGRSLSRRAKVINWVVLVVLAAGLAYAAFRLVEMLSRQWS
jgi:ribosomal protein S27E